MNYLVNMAKISQFALFLYKYFVKRLYFFLAIATGLPRLIVGLVKDAKDYVVRKVIWSRGRLGRAVATFVVMTAAFAIFLAGEVFNGSRFVNSQEPSADYITNTSDVVVPKNTATTLVPENRKRTEVFAYKVESGDTISSIGSKFKVSIDAILYVNNLSDDSILRVGQTVVIPPISGLTHKVASGDTLASIGLKYGVSAQVVADFNYILDTNRLAVGSELIVPGAKVPERPTSSYLPAPSTFATRVVSDETASKNFCVWPSTVRIITTYFTWYHNGLDVATPLRGGMPPLFSCTGGTVTRAGWDPWGLGLHVRISHGGNYETIYGHMSRIDVGVGDKVDRGESIGLMGSTGNSSGPHIHFIIKYKGVPQNPLNYMR